MKKTYLGFIFIFTILFSSRIIFAEDEEVRKDISIIIYNQNFALIKELREPKFKKGDVEWQIKNLPNSIDEDSIFFEILNQEEKCEFIGQNYENDLSNTEKLLNKYLFCKEDVEFYLENDKSIKGKLMYFDAKNIIMGDSDKEPIIINRDFIRQIRLPENPNGLVITPTITWKLKTTSKAYYKILLSYITRNMEWQANYNGIFNSDDTQMALSGNVSINNNTGITYTDAKINLVAGNIGAKQTTSRFRNERKAFSSAEQVNESSVSDYHFYTLEQKIDLKDGTNYERPLFSPKTIKINKIYTYNGSIDKNKIKIGINFKNDSDNTLGIPLPEGKIRLYKKDDKGNTLLIGEDKIANSPAGKDVTLLIGEAFDILAERREMETKKNDDGTIEKVFEIELKNYKKEQVNILVTENIFGYAEIVEQTEPYVKKDAATIEFSTLVPAGEKKIIRYKIKIKN